MLRFIFKLFIFVSPILLLLGLVEVRLRLIPNAYGQKRLYLERNIDSAQVLITGSSEAYRGIKPELLGIPAFSIAFDSQDVYYDTRILLKYLPRARNVRLVVVSISYFTFNGTLEHSEEKTLTSFYYHFWGLPHATPGVRIEDYSLIALYGIPQARDFIWRAAPTTLPEHIYESGNADSRDKGVNAVTDASAAIERHSTGQTPEHVTQNRRYLEELFKALKSRNIQAVIITTPCFSSYSQNMRPGNYRVMQDEIQTLRREFELQYHNYQTDRRFDISDFADSDHLNPSGAEKFSRILRYEVVRKYIK